MYWKLPNLGVLNIIGENLSYKGFALPDMRQLYFIKAPGQCSPRDCSRIAHAHACHHLTTSVPIITTNNDSGPPPTGKAAEMLLRAEARIKALKFRPKTLLVPEWARQGVDILPNFVSNQVVVWSGFDFRDNNVYHHNQGVIKGIGPYNKRVFITKDEPMPTLGDEKFKCLHYLIELADRC